MSPRWRSPDPADSQSFDPESVFAAGLRNHHVSNTAYPIAHEKTWKPYRVRPEAVEQTARAAWENIHDLSLYVHVPFCETRCFFCEYTVVRSEETPLLRQYMDALITELELHAEYLGTRDRRFHGFDIGGGTPSFVPAEEIARVVEKARESFRFSEGDISIETTPKIAANDRG